MLDCASTTTECGMKNCASPIAPSTLPCWPVPATVVTQALAPPHAPVTGPPPPPPPQLVISSAKKPAAEAHTVALRLTMTHPFCREPARQGGPFRRDRILQDIRQVSALPALQ